MAPVLSSFGVPPRARARMGIPPSYAFTPDTHTSMAGSSPRQTSRPVTTKTSHPLDRHFPRFSTDLDSHADTTDDSDTSSESNVGAFRRGPLPDRPVNHRVKAKSSILCLVVDGDCLIAGLEGGEIVVRVFLVCPRDLSPSYSHFTGLVSGNL